MTYSQVPFERNLTADSTSNFLPTHNWSTSSPLFSKVCLYYLIYFGETVFLILLTIFSEDTDLTSLISELFFLYYDLSTYPLTVCFETPSTITQTTKQWDVRYSTLPFVLPTVLVYL